MSPTRRAEVRATAWRIAPAGFLAAFGGGLVFPILPLVGLRAGLPLAFIGLILAGNRIGRLVANPLIGWLVDRYGGRRLMGIGLACEAAVLGIYWLAVITPYTGPLFLVGRLLYGPASSLVFVGGQTLSLLAGGSEHRGLSTSIVRTATSAGTPAGLVIGGLVAGLAGEPTAFAVAMVATLLGALFAVRAVPNLRPAGDAPRKLRQMARDLSDRRLVGVASLNLLTSFANTGILLSTLVILMDTRHLTVLGLPVEASSGLLLAALMGAGSLGSPLAGRLADRPQGRARTSRLGVALMIGGFIAAAVAHGPAVLVPALVVIGVGTSVTNLPLLALMGDLVPGGSQGSGVGTLQLFASAGGLVGPLVGTAVLGAIGATACYFGVAGLLGAIGLPVATWLGAAERRRAAAVPMAAPS